MKNERLLLAIGNISDEFIINAERVEVGLKKAVFKSVAIAACFAVMVSVVLLNLPEKNKKLPMLTITEMTDSYGFGYEAFMAYDISDLTNANPWTEEASLSTLPVYKNLYTYDVSGELPQESDAYIKKMLNDVKGKTVNISGAKVKNFVGLAIDIEFDPEIELDKKYNFGFYSSYDELKAVGEYFKSQYKSIIDMKQPIINIYHGDYDIYGEQLYNMYFYEGNGSLTEKIINYHFNTVQFHPDDNGRLCRIRIEKTDLSEKVGDYPIIDCNEAERLLFGGKYITTVPYVITDNDKVAKVELVYRNGGTEKYYMPYYKFYVELPDSKRENGLKDFGVYYVPAVESKYLSNMPVWDGKFN